MDPKFLETVLYLKNIFVAVALIGMAVTMIAVAIYGPDGHDAG